MKKLFLMALLFSTNALSTEIHIKKADTGIDHNLYLVESKDTISISMNSNLFFESKDGIGSFQIAKSNVNKELLKELEALSKEVKILKNVVIPQGDVIPHQIILKIDDNKMIPNSEKEIRAFKLIDQLIKNPKLKTIQSFKVSDNVFISKSNEKTVKDKRPVSLNCHELDQKYLCVEGELYYFVN